MVDAFEWPDFPDAKSMHTHGCLVVFSIDDTGPNKFGKLKHASMSRKHALPTWNQVKAIKDRLFGDTDVMMILPKREDYVNLHEYCFHLWQCPQGWGMQ